MPADMRSWTARRPEVAFSGLSETFPLGSIEFFPALEAEQGASGIRRIDS